MRTQISTTYADIRIKLGPLVAAIVCLGLIGCKITPVVVTEYANGNGYQVEMGYQAAAELIIAHVRIDMTMEVNGTVVRRAEQDYWEYFNLKKLTAADEQSWHSTQWPIVKPYLDENFYYQDLIRAGPLLVVGSPPPEQFLVKIRQTHLLYLGGKIQGANPGGQFHGSFGYLEKDAAGNGFVIRRIDSSGVTDDSQIWANQTNPAGRVVRTGRHEESLVLEHEAAWGRAQGEPDWGVEWKYVRVFAEDRLERRGSEVHQIPQAGP